MCSPTVSRSDGRRARRARDRGRARPSARGLEYLGMPAGYELTTLVHAIARSGPRRRPRSATRSLERLAGDRRATSRSTSTSPRPDRTARRPCCWRTSCALASPRVTARGRSRPSEFAADGRPARRAGRARDRRRRPLRLGRRGARGRVRRARARRCRRLTVHTLNPVRRDRPRERAARALRRARAGGAAGRGQWCSTRTRTSATTSTGCVGDRDELLAIQRSASASQRSFVVLPRRARPPLRRSPPPTTARSRTQPRAPDRSCCPSSASTSTRSPVGGGDPLPRPRSARDQAAARGRSGSPSADTRLDARLRARGRARRPDPDPRRPGPAADRRPPRCARRPLRRRPA